MSDLRNAVEHSAELVGVTGIHGARWSKSLLRMFDDDIAKADSTFDRQPGEPIEDRLAILRILYMAPGADWKKVAYLINLFILCATSVDVHKGCVALIPRRDALAASLEVEEPSHPEISATLSVATAKTLTSWN